MTAWARVDCDFNRHPKMARLSAADRLGFLEVILWCREHDTGGRVAAGTPWTTFLQVDEPEDPNAPGLSKNGRVQAATRLRSRLVRAGLLEADGADYILKGYGRRQPPTQEALRAKWREDARRQRSKVASTDGAERNTEATPKQHRSNTEATPAPPGQARGRGAARPRTMPDLSTLLPSIGD